ncbi:hypothetical protein BG910_06085 [Neisseria chenwenguii]|uniref:Uncharacterized protein n=1 Tax=Neisseria chenwenguii TaxID=1853278 RepID=A0A220S2F4_9NEIS|nr:hypothetical protein BG910_06085 [Neisseria chenwenguii]ROV56963.1 hypothetical protein EGS38_02105 [Neisseria chenwenguii]
MPAGPETEKPHSRWGFVAKPGPRKDGFQMKQTYRNGCFRLKLSTVIKIILMLVACAVAKSITEQ